MSTNTTTLNVQEAYQNKKISLAKMGLFIAWISSITAVTQGIFNGIATGTVTTGIESTAVISIIISITLLAINDIFAGIWSLIYNVMTGRSIKEYKRMMNVKVSWMMLLASVAAGPFATGCWMSSVSFCGITYTTAVMSLSPILTAIVGRIVFKENLNARIYLGIIIAVTGVVIAGWAKPEGVSDLFYIGIILAAIAPIGFTAEGMLSTYAADIIDPIIGCSFYRCFGSGFIGLIIITIIAAAVGEVHIVGLVISEVFTNPTVLLFVVLMSIMGAISYNTTYIGFNKCGPTRCLAVVNTMPIWSIPIGMFFSVIGIQEYAVSTMGIVGALVVVVGITLVVAKPSELFSLRDV